MATAPASRSLPRKRKGVARRPASPRSAAQAAGSNPARRSKANARERPGARPMAISAASMTKVPDPHIGSTTGSPPPYPAARRKRAASVSRSGAAFTSCLWPRRCSGSPEVSTETVQRSSSIRTFSATAPSSGSSATGAPSPSRIAAAIRARAAPACQMREARVVTSTRRDTSGLSVSPQGTFRARLSSWARCRARKAAIRASTRVAPRRCRLARQTSGQPPARTTPPGTACGAGRPRAAASSRSSGSRPGGAARKISKGVGHERGIAARRWRKARRGGGDAWGRAWSAEILSRATLSCAKLDPGSEGSEGRGGFGGRERAGGRLVGADDGGGGGRRGGGGRGDRGRGRGERGGRGRVDGAAPRGAQRPGGGGRAAAGAAGGGGERAHEVAEHAADPRGVARACRGGAAAARTTPGSRSTRGPTTTGGRR